MWNCSKDHIPVPYVCHKNGNDQTQVRRRRTWVCIRQSFVINWVFDDTRVIQACRRHWVGVLKTLFENDKIWLRHAFHFH